MSELEADLARARNEEETARNALNDASDQQSAAAERVASAEDDLADARAALDHLRHVYLFFSLPNTERR